MMPRSLAVLLFAGLGFGALAGCMSQGSISSGRPMEALGPPAWKAGYSWTYGHEERVFEGGKLVHSLERDASDSRVVRVLNTSQPLDGEAVYFLGLEGFFDHPYFRGRTIAVTQDGLALAGTGAPPRGPEIMYDMAFRYPGAPVPCVETPYVELTEADAAFPLLTFPLDDGREWQGAWESDGMRLDYRGRVHGLQTRVTPAGQFDAVYIRVDFEIRGGYPQDDATYSPEPHSSPDSVSYETAGVALPDYRYSVSSESWYDPAVGFLVDHQLTVTYQYGGAAATRYVTSMPLLSFSLEAAPEEPAPEVFQPAPPPIPLQVVSDAAFPVNIADGPVEATFGLVQPPTDYGYWPGPKIERVDAMPPPLEFDRGQYRVIWELSPYNQPYPVQAATVEGDTATFAFERGGAFGVSARIEPYKCGRPSLGYASGEAATFYERVFAFQDPVLAGGPVELGSFPVEIGAVQGLATWDQSPTIPVRPDQGQPRLTDPTGLVVYGEPMGPNQVRFYTYPAGEWRIDWDSQAPTFGDSLELRLRLDYTWNDYYYH